MEDVPTKSVFSPLPISHAPTVVNPPGVTFLQVKINTHLLAILKGKEGKSHTCLSDLSADTVIAPPDRGLKHLFVEMFFRNAGPFGATMFHHLMII